MLLIFVHADAVVEADADDVEVEDSRAIRGIREDDSDGDIMVRIYY
jgi:hypothetical protein